MAGSKDFKLAFGVDVTELTSGLTAAKESVEATAVQMKEALVGVQSAFGAIGEAALAVTAIMAGGAAFEKMISSTIDLNVESIKLGKQFGISATQASELKVALGQTFLTQDQISAAANRITRTLNTNEDAFKSLGVATRDQNGNFRSMLDIMTDTNARLLEFKEGTDRNVEGVKIYGRGWQEVSETLRLTPIAMEHAKEAAQELNLTVSEESEAATKRYRDAMVGMKETFEGVFNTIGQALLPGLTSLAEWFRSVGPAVVNGFRDVMTAFNVVMSSVGDTVKALWDVLASIFNGIGAEINIAFGVESVSKMEIFQNVLRVIEVLFIGLRVGVQEASDVIVGGITVMIDVFQEFAGVAKAAFSLDWAGVKTAWKHGEDQVAIDFKASMDKMVADASKGAVDLQNALVGPLSSKSAGTETTKPTGSDTSDGGKAKKEQLMAEWEAELSQRKLAYEQESLAQGSFQQFSLVQEKQYWEDKLALGEATSSQRLALEKKIADLGMAINKQTFDARIAGLKEEEAEYAKNAAMKIGLAQQELTLIAQAYGKGSSQYEVALKHLTDIQRQNLEQQRQIAEVYQKVNDERLLESITADEKALDQKFADHLISASKFAAMEISLENQRTAILASGIKARLALVDPTRDPVTYVQLNAQLEALETKHQLALAAIQQKAHAPMLAMFKNTYDAMQNGFASAISNMMKGTQTFSQGMRSMLGDILSGIIDFLAKWAVQWATTQLLNLVATKSTNAANAASNAAVAGAAGVMSFAGAPWPIDIGAPAFGAAMFADAAAYVPAALAESGYDVPAGISPVTKLHPREMVLPQDIADGMRSLISGGGRGGGGPSSDVNFNGPRMGNFFLLHSDELKAGIQKIVRSGGVRFV